MMHSARRIISLLVAAVQIPLALSAGVPPGVTIIHSDASTLEVVITPWVSFDTLTGGMLLPRIPGASVANTRATGSPIQLELSLPLALPSAEGGALEVVTAEYSEAIHARLAPVPTLIRNDHDTPVERYLPDATAYRMNAAAGPAAELRFLGVAHDVHAAAMVVRPVEYNPAAGSIRILRSITIRVRYATPDAAQRPSILSELSRATFVNADIAGEWVLASGAVRVARLLRRSAARAWMRVEVRTDGLQVLTADDFRTGGIDPASLDASRIGVYGGDGGDVPESTDSIDRDHLHRVPTLVEKGGDGRVSRVYFYGVGPHRWTRAGSEAPPVHELSPYVSANSYIVAVEGESGRDFAMRSGPARYEVEPQWGIARLFFDEEKVNGVDVRRVGAGSGRTWYGTEFTVDPRDRPTDLRTFGTTLPGLERTGPISYRIRVASGGPDAASFQIWQADTRVGEITIGALQEPIRSLAVSRIFAFPDASAVPSDSRSALKIEFSSGSSASGWLDYFEIHYARRLVATDGAIQFDAPPIAADARFQVTGFSSDDLIGLDITDPANPLLLERLPSGDFGVFVFHDALAGSRNERRYFITEKGAARRVDAVATARYADLQNNPANADIVVVAHEDLRTVAENYVAYRNSRGGLRAAYVTTSEIYTEFSHGNLDPFAIRNYLGHAYRTWSTRPQYVIFLGDASYDYRNIVTRQKQLVPTVQSVDGDTYNVDRSTASDDPMLQLTADASADVAGGRLPVETAEQGMLVLDKIIRYESSRDFSAWRHTLLFAADDNIPEQAHSFVNDSEAALEAIARSESYNARKIYLPAYPTEHVTADRKPGATSDLLQYINRGALVTNWIGHGNPKQWAHELLLERDQLIPRLTNDSALTFVAAATCNFGLFDDPAQTSGAELLLLHQAGAVAVMTSSRASYTDINARFITSFFRRLFNRTAAESAISPIGAALYGAKFGTEEKAYHILGDPTLRLNCPKYLVSVDTINGTAVADTTVTVEALSVVSVTGRVTDVAGESLGDFDGTAIVSLYDADRQLSVTDGDPNVPGGGVSSHMRFSGGRLFRGPTAVTRGRFAITFRVPRDISFDVDSARIHVYAYAGDRDAVGATRNVRVFGTDTATVTDTTGPRISLFLDDRTFRSGDQVTSEPLLIVELEDTSGINSSGSSLGHRVEAWIDGATSSIDLTELFQTSEVNFRIGSSERRLSDLGDGMHSVRVRAWDIYNNPSQQSALFRIAEGVGDELIVSNVIAYPNPMKGSTDVTFMHNQTQPLDVDVAIFTVSGRLIRSLEARTLRERFVRVHWDGSDSDGRPVANGVYLYRLRVSASATTVDDAVGAASSFETIEKIAVVR